MFEKESLILMGKKAMKLKLEPCKVWNKMGEEKKLSFPFLVSFLFARVRKKRMF